MTERQREAKQPAGDGGRNRCASPRRGLSRPHTLRGSLVYGLGGQSARSYTGGGGANVVTVPTSASLVSINDSFSLAYWMKSNLTDNGNWVRLFQHANEGSGTQGWMVNRYNNGNEVNVRVDTTGAGGGFNQNIARGGPAPFDNTWHHVVFTVDSGVWTKYEDGAPVGWGTYNHGQGLSNTRDFYMFGRNSTGEYVGFLDEVALYDAKLGPTEVLHLYAGGDPGNLPVNIALGKPIVDGSSAYNGVPFNAGQFPASNVTDGSETDVFGQSYWLGPNGQVNQYLVLDLEDTFQIDAIGLRNTHNTQHNDRGTANFQIRGSNNLADIAGATSLAPIILADTLSNVSGKAPILTDLFTSANGLAGGGQLPLPAF